MREYTFQKKTGMKNTLRPVHSDNSKQKTFSSLWLITGTFCPGKIVHWTFGPGTFDPLQF